MSTLSIPSVAEINQTIEIIQGKVDSGKLSDQVAKGYEEALNILVGRKSSYKDISPTLTGDQARAIALVAVDYLNGKMTQRVLLAPLADIDVRVQSYAVMNGIMRQELKNRIKAAGFADVEVNDLSERFDVRNSRGELVDINVHWKTQLIYSMDGKDNHRITYASQGHLENLMGLSRDSLKSELMENKLQ